MSPLDWPRKPSHHRNFSVMTFAKKFEYRPSDTRNFNVEFTCNFSPTPTEVSFSFSMPGVETKQFSLVELNVTVPLVHPYFQAQNDDTADSLLPTGTSISTEEEVGPDRSRSFMGH